MTKDQASDLDSAVNSLVSATVRAGEAALTLRAAEGRYQEALRVATEAGRLRGPLSPEARLQLSDFVALDLNSVRAKEVCVMAQGYVRAILEANP